MFNKDQNPKYITEGALKEIVDGLLRAALRSQARDLEKHLNSIHKRLLELEKK
jgi:hypothetical protein